MLAIISSRSRLWNGSWQQMKHATGYKFPTVEVNWSCYAVICFNTKYIFFFWNESISCITTAFKTSYTCQQDFRQFFGNQTIEDVRLSVVAEQLRIGKLSCYISLIFSDYWTDWLSKAWISNTDVCHDYYYYHGFLGPKTFLIKLLTESSLMVFFILHSFLWLPWHQAYLGNAVCIEKKFQVSSN